MYNTIIMSDINKPVTKKLDMDRFKIDIIGRQDVITEDTDTTIDNGEEFFQEAVFSGGKQSLKPMEDQLTVVKNLLMDQIKDQEKTDKKIDSGDEKIKPKKFNPDKFWKHQEIKKFEDIVQKIFGFRSVQVYPYIEKYNSKSGDFESKEINCSTYMLDRFPIDGLVTDKGFYDNTHSIILDIRISLGLIKMMEPAELMAILLHEIGHNVDPAITTITYAETNILSKYLTDRKKDLSKAEKKIIEKTKTKHRAKFFAPILCGMLVITGVVASIVAVIKLIWDSIFNSRKNKDDKKNGADGSINETLLKQLQQMIKDDAKEQFGRKNYSEAFADNFARMYGYGVQLTTSFKKMEKNNEKTINSRYSKEKDRQRCIMNIVANGLKNVHKTDVHRVKALIREYYEDINDPNTPDVVKKQLKDDVKEVELVLESYMNDFSEFQNNINKMISDEIDAAYLKSTKKDDKQKDDKKGDDKNINESVDDLYHFYESKKAYEDLMKRKETVTQSERNEFYKIFGKSTECSLAKDKDGYYVYTHRCRSKSYKSISDIPKKDVDFVRSTS